MALDPIAAYVNEIASTRPCVVCGRQYHHAAMNFAWVRELGPRNFVVRKARAFERTQSEVLEEIAKCEVICSNCQRIRQYREDPL